MVIKMNLSKLITKVKKKKGLILGVSLIGIIIGVLMTLLTAYILMFLLNYFMEQVFRGEPISFITSWMGVLTVILFTFIISIFSKNK